MTFSFEEAVFRELDQMRQAMERQTSTVERAVERFGSEVDSLHDQVSQVKISVAELRRDPPASKRPTLVRDGGISISAATVGALLAAAAQYLATSHAPEHPRPAPTAQVAAGTP